MLAANREYAARYPVATQRVIRAVLKAADLCADEPELAARMIVEGGFTERYDYALQTLTENPYGTWRERRRGQYPVLRTARARAGHDQKQSEADHRQRHRLALPERGQTRTEGMSSNRCLRLHRASEQRRRAQ